MLPLTRELFKLFSSSTEAFIKSLLESKNAEGSVPLQVLIKRVNNDSARLFRNLIAVLPFKMFSKVTDGLETLRPGYFSKKIIRRYGPLLLLNANSYQKYKFLLDDCKVPADCRVISDKGHVETSLLRALAKNHKRKATIILSRRLSEIDSSLTSSPSVIMQMANPN